MGNCAGREKNPCDQVVVLMVMVALRVIVMLTLMLTEMVLWTVMIVSAGGGVATTATCSVPEAPFAPGEELSVQVLH